MKKVSYPTQIAPHPPFVGGDLTCGSDDVASAY